MKKIIEGKEFEVVEMIKIKCSNDECENQMLLTEEEVTEMVTGDAMDGYICGVCFNKELESSDVYEETLKPLTEEELDKIH